MIISELIEFLQKCPQGVEVVTRTSINTFVRPASYGLIKLIPVEPGSIHDKRPINRRLLPGNEWREPISAKDGLEIERKYGFVIG